MNYICYSSIIQRIRIDYITIIKFTWLEAKWLRDNWVNMNFVEKSIERRSHRPCTPIEIFFFFFRYGERGSMAAINMPVWPPGDRDPTWEQCAFTQS